MEDEEPTEMTAMTSPRHLEAGGVATITSTNATSTSAGFTNNINNHHHHHPHHNNNNNNNSSAVPNSNADIPLGRAWLKRQLRSPAGKCLFLTAVLGLSVLVAYLGSKLVLGGLFMQSCPAEPFVPIYLVVSAAIFILFMVILSLVFLKCRHRYEEEDSISPIYLLSLVYAFLHLVLQLAGSVCVIRTSNRFDLADDNERCNSTFLTYAFGVVIFELILSSIFFILTMVLLCQVIYVECCKSKKRHINNAA